MQLPGPGKTLAFDSIDQRRVAQPFRELIQSKLFWKESMWRELIWKELTLAAQRLIARSR